MAHPLNSIFFQKIQTYNQGEKKGFCPKSYYLRPHPNIYERNAITSAAFAI